MLVDVGVNPADVLRSARLPDDLLSRPEAQLTSEKYFRLWAGIEEQANDPSIGLRLGSEISVEAFDPPIFAALCSRNFNEALERLSRFKRLIAPADLHVKKDALRTSLEIDWLETTIQPPASLIDAELAFLVQLCRIGTRANISPLEIYVPSFGTSKAEYLKRFGVTPTLGAKLRIVFRAEDAAKPFLTNNAKMWGFFEPELKKRLSELDETATLADRVKASLTEILPGGGVAPMETVSRQLSLSKRTLQRRLKDEGLTFHEILNRTREELARYYLKNSRLTNSEISFLLGFEDPNSFYRAFHSWTGYSPEQMRAANDK